MEISEIPAALDLHARWLRLEPDGKRFDARGANLSGANLSGANLSDADLSDADLSDANLRGANLSGAYLSDANLRGANLSGAYLSGAYLSGARITDDLTYEQIVHAEIGPIGSRNDRTVLWAYPDGRVEVSTGCFRGDLAQFRAAIASTHAEGSLYRAQYDACAVMFATLIAAKFGPEARDGGE